MGDYYGYDALASGARRAFPLLPRLGPGGTAPFNPDAPVYSPPPAAPPPPAPVYTQPEQEESRALQEYLDRPAPAPGPAPPWWKQLLGYATQFVGGPLRQTDLPQRLITGRGLREEQEEAGAAARAQGQREALERRTELAGSAYDRGMESRTLESEEDRAALREGLVRVPPEAGEEELQGQFAYVTTVRGKRYGKPKKTSEGYRVSAKLAEEMGRFVTEEERSRGFTHVPERIFEKFISTKAISPSQHVIPGARLPGEPLQSEFALPPTPPPPAIRSGPGGSIHAITQQPGGGFQTEQLVEGRPPVAEQNQATQRKVANVVNELLRNALAQQPAQNPVDTALASLIGAPGEEAGTAPRVFTQEDLERLAPGAGPLHGQIINYLQDLARGNPARLDALDAAMVRILDRYR